MDFSYWRSCLIRVLEIGFDSYVVAWLVRRPLSMVRLVHLLLALGVCYG